MTRALRDAVQQLKLTCWHPTEDGGMVGFSPIDNQQEDALPFAEAAHEHWIKLADVLARLGERETETKCPTCGAECAKVTE